jgi:glycosyltransferase involved in cell wall biosynthesis
MGLAANAAYRRELEALANALGVAERVRFHDFANDVAAAYAGAAAALNLSRSESFSFTCLGGRLSLGWTRGDHR